MRREREGGRGSNMFELRSCKSGGQYPGPSPLR